MTRRCGWTCSRRGFRAGRILGDLGRLAESQEAFRAAVEGYEEALRERPDDPKIKAGLAEGAASIEAR